MSFELYNNLQKTASDTIKQPLPALVSAKLEHTSQVVNANTLIESVNSIDATFGWVMYRDQVIAATQLGGRTDIIEGEWCNELVSVKVKLLNDNQYLLVKSEVKKSNENTQVYKQQLIHTRFGLASYFIWFQLEGSRWQPFTQQFMGFIDMEDAS